MMLRQFISLILLFLSAQAFADWVDPGAVYRCNARAQSFSIASVMDTSSPEDPGTVSAPAGFSVVAGNRSVKCSLRRTKVIAQFSVRPPQATGMCGGITQISLQSLRVNGKKVFETPVLFNHYCFDDEAIHSIDITEANGLAHVQICYAGWDWGVGYHDVRCVVREL
jgi:hypothetical protein